MGQRLTGMTSRQTSFPVAPSRFGFAQHGQSGAWLSELLPHTAAIADELCFIKSMHTEAINHDPAVTFFMTGRPARGTTEHGLLDYLRTGERKRRPAGFRGDGLGRHRQPQRPAPLRPAVGKRLSPHQAPGDQVPLDRRRLSFIFPIRRGFPRVSGGRCSTNSRELNRLELEKTDDPEIATRIAQYELAYRMQTSVPELTDLSKEPEHVFDLYGPESRKPGTFAANCLLARRLAERGVRFIQLFHRGWDQHAKLPAQIVGQCRDTDQASAALITDLKARGLLGRHAGRLGRRIRPHGLLPGEAHGHRLRPRPSSPLLHRLAGRRRHQAGHDVTGKPTTSATTSTRDPVHVHDLHATLLYCLGIDHTRLTFKYQGRHFRLTDVAGTVVRPILA